MNTLIFALLFFLPAGIANAAPVFANKIPLLNRWKTPIDLGQSYRGRRILGPNKSMRGLVFGTLMGGVSASLIVVAFPGYGFVSTDIVPFVPIAESFLFGTMIGFGALWGDAVESFFKRQKGVASGESWFPFDQIDYILGGLLFSLPFTQLALRTYLTIFLLFFGLHLVSSYIGFLLKLKEKPI